jgi:CheY-like chemotaxis protein
MRELLEASGHRVVEAKNGREALDLIHRDTPDVVFLDLQIRFSTVSVWFANCEATSVSAAYPL